ncbi:hypothetical protein P4493_05965 [Bacillus thuringiensis]|uniref:Uncharacterized protein n=1 Tax=Bacillus thuringiensis TaxID=1428 RepID=A0A0B5NJ04_BACTU|nr:MULTISPECIES: hypothetical protein [Bacillus]MEC2533109.1 hypothetical protein [Bacillus cereus]MED1153911.1 hypothetical protein [Bacillus paranthracis]AJG73946.1 hypothetical protein BF38_6027 [Bacillus thuringiensis]AJH02708.1 hypothetical protein AS86_6330 [Bacillus thuringiensis HD1002]EEM74480.1 hypothetical protein bthur0010_55070 [Bacillus thuringiensis serovar pondicheriensis BGSC 4BA1]
MSKQVSEVGCCWCDEMNLVETGVEMCPSCGKQSCLHVYRENVKAVWSEKDETWVEVEE